MFIQESITDVDDSIDTSVSELESSAHSVDIPEDMSKAEVTEIFGKKASIHGWFLFVPEYLLIF